MKSSNSVENINPADSLHKNKKKFASRINGSLRLGAGSCLDYMSILKFIVKILKPKVFILTRTFNKTLGTSIIYTPMSSPSLSFSKFTSLYGFLSSESFVICCETVFCFFQFGFEKYPLD